MSNIQTMQKYLSLFRKMLGWNAQRLGEEIGVTRQTINNIESEKTHLSKTQYLALLTAFKNEIFSNYNDTIMLYCILDFLILHPNNYQASETEASLKSAQFLVPAISTSGASRKDVSDEWVRSNTAIYNKFIDNLNVEYQKAVEKLQGMNTSDKTECAINNNKEIYNMKTAKKVSFVSLIEEYNKEVTDELFKFITSYIFDSVRHELWMYVDTEGKVSIRSNIGYASTRISNDQRCFLFACGGENISPWHCLPRINNLLDKEDLEMCSEEISAETGEDINHITVGQMQKHIEETRPAWIEQWLDEYYYSDPYGSLENHVQDIYESILSKLDGYEE